MINSSINTRLDDMLTEQPTSTLEQDAPEQSQLMEQINTPAESVFTGEEEQVAGLFKKGAIEQILQPMQKSLKRRRAIDNVPEEVAPKVDTTNLPKSEVITNPEAVQTPVVQPTAPQTKPLTKKQKQN